MKKNDGLSPEQRRVLRLLRRRAFTLVGKLTEFEDLAAQIYPTSGIPSVQGKMQELMSFYSSGYNE